MRNFYNKSRANGTCKTCKGKITKGQPAWWSQKAGWECTNCKPAAEDTNRPELKTDSKLPNVRMIIDGSRADIEFERIIDAATAAVSFGQGNLTGVAKIDEAIKRSEGEEFFSGKTTSQLIESMIHGDAEMTELVERLRNEIVSDMELPTQRARRVRRGRDTGDEIDVDRFLNRIPEMWSRIESDQTPSRRVTITINGAVSYKQKQDELGYRAAAAIALADKLTEMGVSVEVRLMKCTTEGPTSRIQNLVSSVIVKHSDRPMSIRDLATACCLIGAFRLSMIYGSVRYLPGEPETGLGVPTKIPADRLSGDFIAERDITDRSKAIDWVQACIKQFSNAN